MSYAGLYINLDRCPERRAEMEAELARYGLSERYRRHPAAEGDTLDLPNPRLNNGEIGCFISHAAALGDHLGTGEHLHIAEDDTVFAPGTEAVLNRIIASGEIDAYDVLFADIALPLSNDAYREFKTLYDSIMVRDAAGAIKGAAFQILGLSPHMAPAASSYLVNKNALGKIHRLLQDELTQGARLPVDAFLLEKIRDGTIKAGFIFPFITSVRVERTMDSTVRKVADTTLRFTASNLARASFFIGCDIGECEKLFQKHFPAPPAEDRHAQLLAQILAFSLSAGRN